MIYLFCALYPEAAALISHYGLKKDTAESRFQVFCDENGEICLTVTGPGEVAAAAAVGSICTKYQAGRGDTLINVGTCAAVALPAASGRAGVSKGPAEASDGPETAGCCRAGALQGNAFLCSRLTEAATGKTFYPDILYRHGFCERGIVTGMNLIDDAEDGFSAGFCGVPDEVVAACAQDGFFLYDMEAAAVYQAGAYFFGPHQMSFIKIISDVEEPEAEPVPRDGAPARAVSEESAPQNPAAEKFSREELMRLMEANREKITAYIDLLRAAGEDAAGMDAAGTCAAGEEKGGVGARPADGYDAVFAEKLCRDMCCSQTMQAALCQHLRYCALAGIDYHAAAAAMYRDGRLPCRDKREGKLRLEELKRELL